MTSDDPTHSIDADNSQAELKDSFDVPQHDHDQTSRQIISNLSKLKPKEKNLPLLVYHITSMKHEDDSDFMTDDITLRDIFSDVALNSKRFDEILSSISQNHSSENLNTVKGIDSPVNDIPLKRKLIYLKSLDVNEDLRNKPTEFKDIKAVLQNVNINIGNAFKAGALVALIDRHLNNQQKTSDLSQEKIYQAVNELRLRDIRRLDYNFNPAAEPTIIVRRHVILMSFDPIVRALIMADRLYVFFEGGADSVVATLKAFMDDWKFSTIDQNSEYFYTPFEIHAIDGLLHTVKRMQSLTLESISRNKASCMVFTHPGAILPIEEQEKMRNIKNDVNVMKSIVLGHKRALLELMDDDEVLALMNLSKLRVNPRLYQSPLVPEILSQHEHVEELLESYLMDYSALETKLENLRVNIQSAEQMILLRLDTSRNELLIANTSMAVLACSIGFGAYISGIFGMNLDNTLTIQDISGLFLTVFGVTFGLMFGSFYLIIEYYTMTGVLPKKVSKRANSMWKKS